MDIPDNIAEYIDAHDGINLSININNADGDYGYAHMTWYSVVLSRLTRTCSRLMIVNVFDTLTTAGGTMRCLYGAQPTMILA